MPTHVAYSDESYYTRGRHRSIAVVTLETRSSESLNQAIRALLDESGVKEFKWQKLRQARERFAAQKIMDSVIQEALLGTVRVDVLIWDTADSRHKIKGRDDIANLQRMYYHLLKSALKRWRGDNAWALYPDQNSALDWETVRDYLDTAGLASGMRLESLPLFRSRLSNEFHIDELQEVDSRTVPLCQIADFLAGVGAFSRNKFDTYCCWKERHQGQLPLFPTGQPTKLSNSDQERCAVLACLDTRCKAHKLGVSLQTKQGLWTPDPANPVNFWPYEPQHPDDKAPTRLED